MTPEPPRLRLFVPDALAAGGQVALSPAQAHYLGTVMRARAGAALALFNGRDGEWRAVLTECARRRAAARVEAPLRPQAPEPDLWLLFAPMKGGRVDGVVEKATELGASAVLPVLTRRSVVTRVNVERLRAHAVEAAEQCERLSVPEVGEARPLARLLADWPPGRRLLVMDESGAGAPLAEALADMPEGPAALLTGPEGGFDHSELDALGSLPFITRVGLGPRILRADTAAVAALACFQALRGDWRAPPAFRGPR